MKDQKQPKKPYEKPQLKTHGNFQELTKAKGGPGKDGNSSHTKS